MTMVVRRSPLEMTHSSLGASWKAPEVRWPADYGDLAREADSARLSAGLAELGPVGKVFVRGPGMAAAISAAGGEYRPATLTVTHDLKANAADRAGSWGEVWGLAPGQALLICQASDEARAWLERPGVAAVDVSSGLSLMRLVGPNAAAVLSELCPLDLRPDVFPDRRVAQAPLAQVRIVLARLDWRGGPGYVFLVAREYAEYLWDALLDIGQPHGLSPVGASAIEAGLAQ